MHRPSLPLQVLITTPNLDTAGGKYVIADLVKGFDRNIICPSICVHHRKGTGFEAEIEALVNQFLEIPLRMTTRPLSGFARSLATVSAQLRNQFDIVHSFDYASNWTEGAAVRLARLPWVVQKTNMNWGAYRWWLRSFLASRIVSLSNPQFTRLFQNTIFQHKTRVIHLGIDLSLFDTAGVDVQARRELDIPSDSVVIGCVAHLVPVKGHPELLKAFAAVTVDHPGVYLVLVGRGDPEYERELKELTSTLGISGKVRFLGAREDVPRLLHVFDGLVLASRKEAFGAVLVEGMAAGLPIMATRSGGPEDIVIPGETGWLVNAEGVEPLVAALIEFLNNEKHRKDFGRKGRERAERMFAKELMVQRYQQLYLEVAGAGHGID